jgi:hypothetical protein
MQSIDSLLASWDSVHRMLQSREAKGCVSAGMRGAFPSAWHLLVMQDKHLPLDAGDEYR